MVLPIDILVGVYLGLLSGIIPAVVGFGLGFLFKYITGVTLPGLGVVVLGLAIAGVNGGLLALNDPAIIRSTNAPILLTALVVVLMMTLFAHNRGDTLGANLPRRLSLRGLRDQTLSKNVIEFVGGRGQARIEIVGEVTDIEGMPPLPDDIRADIRGSEWVLPADLSLEELETQLSDRLRTAHDLSEVNVGIDGEGRATVSAAPPTADISKRVPRGHRAVSVEALIPTGIARGDKVTVHTAGNQITGTVVSARSGGTKSPSKSGKENQPATIPDGGTEDPPENRPTPAPTTTGGDGRITLAVQLSEVPALMQAQFNEVTAVVEPRGIRREYELLGLLRRAGHRFDKLTISPDTGAIEQSLTIGGIQDEYGVAVVAIRQSNELTIAPTSRITVEVGDEVYLVGSRSELNTFIEAIA